MSKDSKTPQAFPYSGEGDELNYSKGMFLRDYFAIRAFQTRLSKHHDWTLTELTEQAYQDADAMLKARKA